MAMTVLMACVFSVRANAQDVQLATLQHGETMTAYYGGTAFVKAMEAAVAGDVITLSAGTFTAPTIDKAVTIQGSGYVQDAANNRYATVITGDCTINLPEEATGLTIEGIYTNNRIYVDGKATLMAIKRCRLATLRFTGQSENCIVQQCRINTFRPDALSENLFVQNTVIYYMYDNSDGASLVFENCTFTGSNIFPKAVYRNSIIYCPSGNAGSSYYYNVYCPGNLGNSMQENNTSLSISDFRNLFVGGNYGMDGNVKLTDEAAAQYLGYDGTQVGVYGGEIGFTDVPSNPQILSKNIATKSEDGKLSIKISVEAQD